MSLKVKLNIVKSKIMGVDQETGLKVELTTDGKGPTLATTTPQDAKIEFYELPGTGDTETKSRLFATLSFQITVDAKGKDPKLNGNNVLPTSLKYEAFVRGADIKSVVKAGGVTTTTYKIPDFSSDFWLDLTISQGSNFESCDYLFLPWESDTEKNSIEIGAKLIIGTTVEADIKQNNIATIIIDRHMSFICNDSGEVVRKATKADKNVEIIDFVGVGMVYPLNNSLWQIGADALPGAKKAAKAVSSAINIFIHDQIISNASTSTAPITLADISSRLVTIFTNAGLPSPTVSQKTDTDLTAAGFERRTTSRGKRWAAKASVLPNPDNYQMTEGLVTNFFDFWVVYEPTLAVAIPTEAAEAEQLVDFDPSATPAKKQLLWPSAVVPNCATVVKSCGPHPTKGASEYGINELVKCIAHELGHCLGLRHALRSTGTGYDLGPAGHFDLSRGLMSYSSVTDGVSVLGDFGPVHNSVLAKRFT